MIRPDSQQASPTKVIPGKSLVSVSLVKISQVYLMCLLRIWTQINPETNTS